MWPPASFTRFLRRLWLILVIVALIYFLNYIRKYGLQNLHHSEMVVERERPLIWRTLQEHLPDSINNRTNDRTTHCRNSVQGRELLADDRGYVCPRTQMPDNGCCNIELPDTLYYVCDTCNSTSHCCEVYEYCVSCCLQPKQRPILEVVLNRTKGRQSLVYAAVEDHFELCLVKCRTNSHSVEHENRYRNVEAKYCYGYTEAHESQREVSGSSGS